MLLASGLSCLSVNAQPVVLTNAELNNEKLFIEAEQEKLLGAYDEAVSLYLEVLENTPDNDAAQYELARVYEAQGQNDKALDYIDRAIRNSPDNEWYAVMKGDILEGMEEYAAAVDVYQRLITMNPKQEYYYEHLVDLLERINRPEDALQVLDKHEQVAGVVPDLIFKKVDLLNEVDQPEKGVDELEKLIRLYPGEVEYLHRIAAQCVHAGDTTRAREYYQQILDIEPDDGKARLVLAEEYKKAGDDVTYLQSISGLMANPAVGLDAKVLELIPYVERYADDQKVAYADELRSILAKLASQYPNEAKAHAIYGDFLFSAGDLDTARKEYERTLTLDKGVYAVWEQLMYLKLEQQDYDGMLNTAEQALDVFPNQGSIYYLRGVALSQKQDFQAAAASLQQALIMSGKKIALQGEILTLLGNVYYESGQLSNAFDAFAKAIKVMPRDGEILNRYAYLLALNGQNLNQAKDMAMNALEMSHDSSHVEHTLGVIALQQGDFNKAKSYLESSIQHGGGADYRVLEHYGDALIGLGEEDKAVNYWQQSLDAGNPSEILKRKISERKMLH